MKNKSLLRQLAYLLVLFLPFIGAAQQSVHRPLKVKRLFKGSILPGADQTYFYADYLKGKNVGMVVNQTSVIGDDKVPTVDSMLDMGIKVKKIFSAEHGFRGDASNGAEVSNSVDRLTGLPIISLYGNKHYKPTAGDLAGIDIMIFDMQDVGARFYTYLSTLHYVMEACAENNIELMIWDRPNPNGFYVDGPVLDTAFRSFVGMDPIPIVHGLTIAEYAQMVNGEGWLKDHIKCKLHIVQVANYTHNDTYVLPVNPSPNLNTDKSVLLYPSVCLFEGTTLSVARGTDYPFQAVGSPALAGKYQFSFKPVTMIGMSENPPYKYQVCYGIDLRGFDTHIIRREKVLNIGRLIALYKAYPEKDKFFTAYFSKLAGTDQLQKQIEAGVSEQAIRKSWEPALSQYKAMRKKYLLYP
jgi:uncharacterized protein YbbC (DUF1343 family)